MIGELAPEADWVVPPSLDVHVAVKPVMALPPVPFAVNATSTELRPRTTEVSVGASGVAAATKLDDAADDGLSPKSFETMAVQV